MSKNDMVMVPREWLENTIGAGPGEPICRSDIELLKAALADDQHQGEPVALPARKHIASPPQAYTQRGHDIGWNACLDEIAKLGPLYSRPVQGEPVAWRVTGPSGVMGTYTQEPHGWAHGYKIEPLYTHADPGEVEQGYSHEVVHAMQSKIDALRAQLAERDALLRLARQFVVNGVDLGYIQMPDADTPDPAHDLVPKIDAALSASAEPSAPVTHPINMKTMMQAYEQVDHKALLHGTSNWCAAMATALRGALHREPSAPVAQCTNEDSWNCKYCRSTESCEALKDPRNFGEPGAPVELGDPCEWSDQQVLDFLGVALRNVDMQDEVRLSEIRQGFQFMRDRAALGRKL